MATQPGTPRPHDAHTAATRATAPLPAPIRVSVDPTHDIPKHLGRYTILRVLGEGGMGTVYEAEQESPRRTVALKVIRSSFISPELLRRFEQESRILGRLQHPGIAQVYEAGTISDERGESRPFFAMEFIKGVPLNEFADKLNLGTRDRLKLIAKICDAVYHAHQKGVIHRDLKPGNIVVDKMGQPKVLDFGVARATDADVQQATLQTDIGQLVGTLPYMSPEQVGGDPDEVDTRTDVYALGVIAYELLAGRLPHDVRRKMIPEAARIIREEEPTKLSVVDRTLRGDVETIVAKALDKDKARRYPSAESLASDIRRYLRDEPIAARPASTWYQAVKFSRRNKGLVAGLGAAFVLLIAGVAGMSLALNRAWRAESDLVEQLAKTDLARIAEAEERTLADEQRDRAVKAEAEARRREGEITQIADFQAKMLRRIDPRRAGQLLSDGVLGRFERADPSANDPPNRRPRAARREFAEQWKAINATDVARDFIDGVILTPAVNSLDRQFKDQPAIDARLRQALAEKYAQLGTYDRAVALQERALKNSRESLGEQHPRTREAYRVMGDILAAQGKPTEAAPYYRAVLERRPPYRGHAAARLLIAEGDAEAAEPYLRAQIREFRRRLEKDALPTLLMIDRLGVLLSTEGRLDEAEACFREALEGCKRRGRDSLADEQRFTAHLGAALLDQGRAPEAEPLCREALTLSRRLNGNEHPTTLLAIASLAGALHAQQRNADAVALLAPIESACRAAFTGSNAPKFASMLTTLGASRGATGAFSAGEANLLEAHALFAAGAPGRADDQVECVQALVDLYNAWHAAEPAAGHDARATDWKATLSAEPAP